MKRILAVIFIGVLALFQLSCTRSYMDPVRGKLHINLQYAVDAESLFPDTIRYVNQAGNHYSVSRLEYYLSGLTFHSSDGLIYRSNRVFYVNALESAYAQIVFDSIPFGHYSSISFHIGLPPGLNASYSLPNTTENINMSWPDVMGGGYHFLKLEGNVTTTAGPMGYAMHLGNNASLVNITVPVSLRIQSADNYVSATMNVNEWFRDPNTYDLLVDGNHIMGIQALMSKFAANGYNVFSFK